MIADGNDKDLPCNDARKPAGGFAGGGAGGIGTGFGIHGAVVSGGGAGQPYATALEGGKRQVKTEFPDVTPPRESGPHRHPDVRAVR